MLEHGDLHTVEHVLERFNAIGDRLGQANVRQPLGKLYLGQSEPDSIQAVARILDQALALYQEIGDRVGQTNIYIFYSQWLAGRGQIEEALSFGQEALELEAALELITLVAKGGGTGFG
jgi:hypothetical protein